VKKKIKTALKAVSSVAVLRTAYIVLSLAFQLALIFLALWALDSYFLYFYFISSVFGLVLSLTIINNRSNPAYKITWIILILFLPVFGTMIYLLFGSGHMSKRVRNNLQKAEDQVKRYLHQESDPIETVMSEHVDAARQMQYLMGAVACPPYGDTSAEFLSPGEMKFECMKRELRKAEKFIFMEYFIISNGQMWDEILEILKEKAKAGVEVRVMYDDFGSLLTLPNHYERFLAECGIKCCIFGELIPVLSALLNHRDHRKILVIDGKVGFTGGINISDEYINVKVKHGHWKDSSIILRGAAVWSLTVFFLSTWGYVKNVDEDFLRYRVAYIPPDAAGGIAQPYYDSPLDGEQVGENVYFNMVARAKRYVYIETPYLILDNEMSVALCNAAKQGVDVRIAVPHIGDHWYVHAMTRSNYTRLTESGVRIYEYTPGFIHAKVFVCDDELAVVGTINLDYRSLYLHFENAVLLYKMPMIADIMQDFHDIIAVSHEVTHRECLSTPWYRRMGRALIKVFAPLM